MACWALPLAACGGQLHGGPRGHHSAQPRLPSVMNTPLYLKQRLSTGSTYISNDNDAMLVYR